MTSLGAAVPQSLSSMQSLVGEGSVLWNHGRPEAPQHPLSITSHCSPSHSRSLEQNVFTSYDQEHQTHRNSYHQQLKKVNCCVLPVQNKDIHHDHLHAAMKFSYSPIHLLTGTIFSNKIILAFMQPHAHKCLWGLYLQ